MLNSYVQNMQSYVQFYFKEVNYNYNKWNPLKFTNGFSVNDIVENRGIVSRPTFAKKCR